MTKLTLPGGLTVLVTDRPDGGKQIWFAGPHGQGALDLDEYSAREVALALAPQPAEEDRG